MIPTPIADNQYVSPEWKNGQGQEIDAEELQAMSDTLEKSQWTKSYMDFLRIERIAPYLYNAHFQNLNYEAALDYYRKYKPIIGACSVAVKGNTIGSNYDWKYNEQASFVCHTPAELGRHKVIGLSTSPEAMTQEIILQKSYSPLYDIVPFMLIDGINDAGLFCKIQVVTPEKGVTRGTNPDGEDLFALMIPRFCLDYAEDVDEAIELLRSRNIFCADNQGTRQEFHILLSDFEKTVVVEFVNNEMVVLEAFIGGKQIMTNFFLSGYDGTRESLTPYAQGIERQEILTRGIENVRGETEMQDLMNAVRFTLAYDEAEIPTWYSEFSGGWETFGNLTKDSPPEAYTGILAYVRGLYENRTRNGETWHTVHSAVYNRSQRSFCVIPQESGKTFDFRLDSQSTVYPDIPFFNF